MRLFKRNRRVSLVKAPIPNDPDRPVRIAWGIAPAEWSALTDTERAGYRSGIVAAPRFNGQ